MDDKTNALLADHLASTKGHSVTRASIEAIIAGTEYNRLTPTLTLCMLTLANGFVVLGQSACVDPANYNQEIGEKIAYNDAFEKIWQLEGYLLATRLMLLADQGATDRIAQLDNELQQQPGAAPADELPPAPALEPAPDPAPEPVAEPAAEEPAPAAEEVVDEVHEDPAEPVDEEEPAPDPAPADETETDVSRETAPEIATEEELPPRDAAPAREVPETHRQLFDDATAADAVDGGTAHVDAFWNAYDQAQDDKPFG